MKQQIIELLREILDALQPDSGEVQNLNHDPEYLRSAIRRQIHELKSDEIHVSWVPHGTGPVRLHCYNGIFNTKEVEEVRHLVEKQEQAEELPYAVRNLNLPDLEDEPPCTVNDDLNLRVAELYREKTGVYPSWYLMVEGRVKALIELNEHKNFAREDLDDQREKEEQQAREDEEIDRLAREEVESSLYEDGIIEDPDCDGGLLG